MKITIHRTDGSVLLEGEYPTPGRACELHKSNLHGADLAYADLTGADLRGANLGYAYLEGACLEGANLGYAYLEGAYLEGANLVGANFEGATLSWQDHTLISEILWRAATTESQRMLAAYVGRRIEWCWKDWREYQHPDRKWALAELRKWIKPDDGSPAWLREEVTS